MFRHARVGEETRRGRCEMGNISLRDPGFVTAAERGREFWRGVLLAGGFTAVPRWTLDPVPGIAEHETKICNEVVAALRRLADELAGPLRDRKSTRLNSSHKQKSYAVFCLKKKK